MKLTMREYRRQETGDRRRLWRVAIILYSVFTLGTSCILCPAVYGGWSKQSTRNGDNATLGKFKSLCALPPGGTTPAGEPWLEDQVYAVVERVIDGNTVTTIEQFTPQDWGSDPNYCWFVDGGWKGDTPNRLVYHPAASTDDVLVPCEYPTLQELTAEEIPDAPAEPSVTAATTPVSNYAELQAMTGSGKYYLTGNIDLTGETWTPITTIATGFVLDGRDFTISNLTINAPATTGRALFFTLPKGVQIYDLNLNGFYVKGSYYVAAIAGLINAGGSVFKNITFTDCTIEGTGGRVGCLTGYFDNADGDAIYNCNVVSCAANLTSSAGYELGGLLGNINGKYNMTNESDITNCSVDADTTITWVGSASSVYESATRRIGGLAGEILGDTKLQENKYINVHSCYSEAELSSTNGYVFSVGTLIGNVDWMVKIVDCYATGGVTISGSALGSFYVGAFVGNESTHSTYINCYSTGDVSITASTLVQKTGGFIGHHDYTVVSHVLRCYTTSDLTIVAPTVDQVGGFIGGMLGKTGATGTGSLIERSWAAGDIDITGTTVTNIGGFAGKIDTHDDDESPTSITIQNCFSWSEIATASDYVAGFLGATSVINAEEVTITNCYDAQTDTAAGSGFTNAIPAGANNGGFVAYEDTESSIALTASFWDTETSGHSTSLYGVGHVTDWLQTKANYEAAGWDFDTIWTIVECTEPGTDTPESWETIDSNDLVNMTVCVYADGLPRGTFLMDGNDITDFNEADYDVVIAGLNYYSKLETLPLIVSSEPNDIIADKQVTAVKFDFDKTFYFEYGMGKDATMVVCDFNDIITSRISFSRVAFPFGSRKKATIYIQSDTPVPLGIRGIYPEVTYFEPR